MSHIHTETGWRPLWQMSLPERPQWPGHRPQRKEDEAWLTEQHDQLLALRALNSTENLPASRRFQRAQMETTQ